jgi:hypothetical protein
VSAPAAPQLFTHLRLAQVVGPVSLTLHVALVLVCCPVLLLQAVFVAASYPSVPRIDLALCAWRDQQKAEAQKRQQEEQQQQQQQQAARGGRKAPRQAASGSPPSACTPGAGQSR